MPYRFLEDIAIADMAFEAEGGTLSEVFQSAALAVTNTMVKNLEAILPRQAKEIAVTAADAEMLLFNFLQELIYYKDTEQLLLSKFEIEINSTEEGRYFLKCRAFGEKLDTSRHESLVDVKAVTMHKFEVKPAPQGWRAKVILDI